MICSVCHAFTVQDLGCGLSDGLLAPKPQVQPADRGCLRTPQMASSPGSERPSRPSCKRGPGRAYARSNRHRGTAGLQNKDKKSAQCINLAPQSRITGRETVISTNPQGPCTQIAYTLAPKYLYRDYFKAKVYNIWYMDPKP